MSRQFFDGYAAAGRFADEGFFVNSVERSKVLHVIEEARRLDDFRKVRSSCFEDSGNILDSLFRLGFDALLELARLRIDAGRTRNIQHTIGYHSLGIRTDSFRCVLGNNYIHGNTLL